MNRLPFEQLRMEQGVIQELTEQDRNNNLLFRACWKGGLTLNLSYNRDYYWISVEKDDSIFKRIRLDQEKYVMEKLQNMITSIERGNFARQKSTTELVAKVIQERQLTSCMNNTKWEKFRNAMLEEMPFRPPYEIKTLFDEDDTFIQNFIKP